MEADRPTFAYHQQHHKNTSPQHFLLSFCAPFRLTFAAVFSGALIRIASCLFPFGAGV
jgi:hypothetical protein